MENWIVFEVEKEYLRDLAKTQLEYASLPIMKERETLWYQHNDLMGVRPMVSFEAWTCEQDLLPQSRCESEAAKKIEYHLQREILNHEKIGDDRVVPSWYNLAWDLEFILFDLPVDLEHSTDSAGRDLGHQFLNPIKNIADDLHLLKPSRKIVDRERTLRWKAFLEDILGDILPVRMSMESPFVCLSQDVVHLMGMEQMIYSLIDYPDEMQELMRRLTDEHIGYLRWMEREKLLFLNNGNDWLNQGSFGFTHDLPGPDYAPESIQLKNLWGFMDSQETVGISPEMFGEFFFPYYLEIAKYFGLLSYGCCEPVHPVWEKYICKLPNLRKLSISPWCDEAYMGNALRGSNIIYHRKPSPNYIGVGAILDETAFREHILKSVESARGCKMEISFRDIYTLNGNPHKVRKAIQIVREVLETSWRS
jgi:hypothetical protein